MVGEAFHFPSENLCLAKVGENLEEDLPTLSSIIISLFESLAVVMNSSESMSFFFALSLKSVSLFEIMPTLLWSLIYADLLRLVLIDGMKLLRLVLKVFILGDATFDPPINDFSSSLVVANPPYVKSTAPPLSVCIEVILIERGLLFHIFEVSCVCKSLFRYLVLLFAPLVPPWLLILLSLKFLVINLFTITTPLSSIFAYLAILSVFNLIPIPPPPFEVVDDTLECLLF